MTAKYKILMLEDDDRFVYRIRTQLKRKNMIVDSVKTEEDAIKKLHQKTYDLLTIDFILNNEGEHNGEKASIEKNKRKTFIKKLRREENVLIPIIIISHFTGTVSQLLDVGANDYINKAHIKSIPETIDVQIENSIPTLLKKYPFLEERKQKIKKPSIDIELNAVTKIIKAYERSDLSSYALPYREKRKDLEYQLLLQKKLTIDEIHLSNLVVFKDVSWNPQPNINILLGRNGYGKTFLSRILLSLMCDSNYALDFFGIDTQMHRNNEPQNIQAKIRIKVQGEEKPMDIHQSKAFFNSATPKIPILAIPDVRTFDKARKQLPTDIQEDILGNSASAYIQKRPFNNTILYLLNLLCGYWRDGKIEGKKKHIIFKILERVYHKLIEDKTFEFVDKEGEEDKENNLYVKSSFTNGEKIKLQEASQGTLSVMVIFGLIYEYLVQKNRKSKTSLIKDYVDVENGKIECPISGIVFIDEIDSHLHTSWQQKIVPLLREIFPNVQFFLNSHSPLIVMGCLEGEVCRLNKQKEDKHITFKQFTRNFIGFTTQRLYNTVFEIKDEELEYMEWYKKWLLTDQDELKKSIEELKARRAIEDMNFDELKQLVDYENRLKHVISFQKAQMYRKEERSKKELVDKIYTLNKENQRLQKEINTIQKSNTNLR